MLAAFVHSDALCSGFACLMSCRYLASSGRPHSYRLNPLYVREKCAQSPERMGILYRNPQGRCPTKKSRKAKRASYFKSGICLFSNATHLSDLGTAPKPRCRGRWCANDRYAAGARITDGQPRGRLLGASARHQLTRFDCDRLSAAPHGHTTHTIIIRAGCARHCARKGMPFRAQ
jgi:hypothetical protein